jgi:cell shape-determining protein MreC
MTGLRFNHVFGLLLLFCAVSAFFLTKFLDPARAQVQGIYAPVERPALAVAQWIGDRFSRRRTPDSASPDAPRPDAEIRQENLDLRQTLVRLTTELQKLEQTQAEYEELGSLGKLCTRYPVSAGDSGTSESLVIGGGNLSGLKANMPAVYPGGIAGLLQTPGLTGTRVRLLTDRGFKSVTGVFLRFEKTADGHTRAVPVTTDARLVSGEGNNSLLIDSVPLDEAKAVHVGDWFIVEDSDPWFKAVQGQLVGRVNVSPAVSRRSPGFAEVRLEPAAHLMQLRELMIVDKTK